MKKIGLFFGAGAEISLGLPSGGKFALDIFRQDVSNLKRDLSDQLKDNINDKLIYATDWLPKDYKSKRIHAFGKNEFGELVESTIEFNRNLIIDQLENFDNLFVETLSSLSIQENEVDSVFHKLLGRNLGVETYVQAIRMNELLKKESQFFSSKFFSALLDLIKYSKADHKSLGNIISRYAGAFLQLYIGAHGQELVQRLNQELFIEAPDDIPIFDDLFGLFKIEYSKAGLLAIELLMETEEKREIAAFDKMRNPTDYLNLFIVLCKEALDLLFSKIMDYQALIDSHFRYLYSPKKEWAKFTKMVLFLRSAHQLIVKSIPEQTPTADGYYTDLHHFKENLLYINAIGTSNYNNIIDNVLKSRGINLGNPIYHLNGAITDYYNPYKNTVINCSSSGEVPKDQIYVPFILTQSGLKPLTSVSISRRYVELFDSFVKSDAVVVIGYNFNSDDSHINGLFRELIESSNKKLFWVTVGSNSADRKRELLSKLRLGLDYKESVELVCVDPETRKVGDKLWVEKIRENLYAM